MRISAFIRNNIEAILQEWEQFANEIQPKKGNLDKKALRDHAKLMLEDIADDLDSTESKHERAEKSKGRNQELDVAGPAEDHGLERLQSGFGIIELVSEYRFLRASVSRLLSEYRPQEEVDSNDLIRFNEALDKQIAGAVASFSVEKEKQTLLFVTVLSSSSDNGYILDLDGKFLYANKPMLQTFNISPDELVGKSHFDLGFSTASEIRNNLRHVIQSAENRSGEVIYTLPSGEERYYEYVFSPILDDENKVEAVAATERDATDRKLAGERDWRDANHDSLTGLPNRRLFRDRLDHDVKHAARTTTSLALLFIDLDHFKEINDRLGHDAGDQLLKQVKERIVPCVRDSDTVARLGGDEFTVILLEPGEIEQIVTVVDKILKQLALPFSIFNETVNISGCIGITLLPQDATEPEQLLKNADRAMYAAKKAGGNRFCFFNKADKESCLDTVKISGWSS
jgi:diguanylate cyclase (GGDEF)-like protein/PAS domain S-box-containing protein